MSDTARVAHMAAIRKYTDHLRHRESRAVFASEIERHADALAADLARVIAYARHLEPYAARHSVLPGDDEDDAVGQARAEAGVAAIMADRAGAG